MQNRKKREAKVELFPATFRPSEIQSETNPPALGVPGCQQPDPTTQLITPHLGVCSWPGDESLLEGQIGQPLLKDTKEGTSATVAGSLFQSGFVLRKKLFLYLSVDVEYCWYLNLP